MPSTPAQRIAPTQTPADPDAWIYSTTAAGTRATCAIGREVARIGIPHRAGAPASYPAQCGARLVHAGWPREVVLRLVQTYAGSLRAGLFGGAQ